MIIKPLINPSVNDCNYTRQNKLEQIPLKVRITDRQAVTLTTLLTQELTKSKSGADVSYYNEYVVLYISYEKLFSATTTTRGVRVTYNKPCTLSACLYSKTAPPSRSILSLGTYTFTSPLR